ncbi:MAG: TIGR01212 family radical SAM protein [Candidatus Eisenbacteria bacterium]|uniref:TIGR01212 family radical SAM protein n=1 Tax=Eiseniibacteriota bacterium TaxID=2212470 RepID=A0A948S0N4_UNCEI|nr:TIGR01212 family radical SAM protein [Candidatus Eisenbacteria bacterium]MBU1950450.1 TIGR01212 family radical SAM protein [Candidatus Eisenbacteria bacterium]MBU2692682.1 TIGR01212 family radical SAM protein [Candidatus Eisenbacteria bacterium]
MIKVLPRYRKLNTFLRSLFGERVYRVSLRGDFTCPNRDGRLGSGGCLFCNQESTEPLGFVPGQPLSQQLKQGAEYLGRRYGAKKFIAFFENYTTTYKDVGTLERLYCEALSYPGIVGLAVSTRPDCLPDEVLNLLKRISRETFLWVELGIQSANESSLEMMNRCHTVECSERAIQALHEGNIAVSAHVILDLPGESMQEVSKTAAFLADTGVQGIKIHNLHVIKNTRLAEMYNNGDYTPMELTDYVELVIRFLEKIPPHVIIQRLSGEAPRRLTVAPEWSVNKLAVLNAIEDRFEQTDSWQGKGLGISREELMRPINLPGRPAD